MGADRLRVVAVNRDRHIRPKGSSLFTLNTGKDDESHIKIMVTRACYTEDPRTNLPCSFEGRLEIPDTSAQYMVKGTASEEPFEYELTATHEAWRVLMAANNKEQPEVA